MAVMQGLKLLACEPGDVVIVHQVLEDFYIARATTQDAPVAD